MRASRCALVIALGGGADALLVHTAGLGRSWPVQMSGSEGVSMPSRMSELDGNMAGLSRKKKIEEVFIGESVFVTGSKTGALDGDMSGQSYYESKLCVEEEECEVPGDDEFTIAVLGDLHLDPRKMEDYQTGREHFLPILQDAKSRGVATALVSLGDLGESKSVWTTPTPPLPYHPYPSRPTLALTVTLTAIPALALTVTPALALALTPTPGAPARDGRALRGHHCVPRAGRQVPFVLRRAVRGHRRQSRPRGHRRVPYGRGQPQCDAAHPWQAPVSRHAWPRLLASLRGLASFVLAKLSPSPWKWTRLPLGTRLLRGALCSASCDPRHAVPTSLLSRAPSHPSHPLTSPHREAGHAVQAADRREDAARGARLGSMANPPPLAPPELCACASSGRA